MPEMISKQALARLTNYKQDYSHWLWAESQRFQPVSFRGRVKKISLIVACLNEEATIGLLIESAREYCDEIIVVDGHSKDNTVSVAKEAGAIIHFDHRKGKGDALRVGARAAQHEILVFIDADLSHDPHDIVKIVKPILEDKADHVIASRPRGGSDELHGDFNKFCRTLGSDVITLSINYRFGVRLTDSQNGYRAILRDRFFDFKLVENITTIEQELTMKSLHWGHRLYEIPSHEYARAVGDSHIKLARVAPRYVYSWLKYLFFGKL